MSLYQRYRGVFLFILSGILFTLVSIPIRMIGEDIPSLEKTFFRNIFGFIIIFLVISQNKRVRLKTNALYLQILRATLGVCAMSLNFYAIEHANLAAVTSITFLRPILVTFLAIFIFGEFVGIRRWMAMLVGFFGVLVTTGFSFDLEIGVYAMLASVVFMSLVTLTLKKLSTIDPPEVTVFMMGMITTPISLALTLLFSDWVWPSGMHWFWLFSMGLLASLAQLAFTHSLRCAALGELFPYEFLKLIWAIAIGVLLFGEAFEWHILLGGSIILCATAYVTWRNTIKKTGVV